jgi:hypothetical protein
MMARIDALAEHLREQNDRLENATWDTHLKARESRERLDRALQASSNPWQLAMISLSAC